MKPQNWRAKRQEKDRDPTLDSFLSIDDPRLAFITNKWSRTIIQPILISLVLTAMASAVLVLTEVVTEHRGWLIFGLFVLFATLEGCYTTLWLKQPERRLLNHTAYRAAELLLLFVLLRLFVWAAEGTWPAWADLPDILRRPYLLVLDASFIWSGILSLVAWSWAIRLGGTFTELSIDQAEVFYYSKPQSQRSSSDKPVRINRGEIVLSFFRIWITGAVLLAFVTAISTVDLINIPANSPFSLTRLGLRPELLSFLLLYFLGGLALLSQAQLLAMNARWLINGTIRGGQVERSWHRYTLGLLGGIALLAAFLPLGSTIAISNILQTVVWAISTATAFILALITGLIGLLLSFFSGGGAAEQPEQLLQPTPQPMPTPTPTAIPSALPPPIIDTGLLLSSMFWAVAIVMSVLAISFFLRERGVQFNKTTAVIQNFWQRVRLWLQAAWQGAGHQVRDWQQGLRARLRETAKTEPVSRPPWRFIRLNALSPRDQIRYFYLATVKRAADRGVPRQPEETPLEFAQDLKESWPEAEEDVDALTDAFLEARYGRSAIDKKDVAPVKKRWRQIKSSLRRQD